MSAITPRPNNRPDRPRRGQIQRDGIGLLAGIVLLMWAIETINTLDSNGLVGDGIIARNAGHLWGIFTAPFIHASYQHLISNTVPLVFMGVIIALRGAARLAAVTLIVIVVGGIGTWLISPSHSSTGVPISTIGASGVVFGYATYLLARGFFDGSALELLTGAVVGAAWGGALLASIVPQAGVSWQGHVSGAIGGVVAASVLRRRRPDAARPGRTTGQPAGALSK
jgi:membrane associated rhomboid family serine protease